MTGLEIFLLACIFLEAGIVVSMSIAVKYWVKEAYAWKRLWNEQRHQIDNAIEAVERAERRIRENAKPQVWPGVIWPDTIEEKE